MSEHVLYGNPGWGSAIVEAQLAWYGLPYAVEDVANPFTSPQARARLAPLHPIALLPWFAAHCPKLPAIAVATEAVPELRAEWPRNVVTP